MKKACEGSYREKESRELCNGNDRSLVSVICRLALACSTVHSVFIYLIFIILLLFTASYSTPQSLSLHLSLTLSLSFCHNSKYPVGPGCKLLVLVYLALGSIRLQAEASHSSQSHKMWLVLTTALQGDGLIGLIASDRLGWTLYRKTAACLPFSAFVFLFSLWICICFFLTFIFVNLFLPPSLYNSPSVFIFGYLQTVSLYTLSLIFLFASYLSLTSSYAHKLHSNSQT